MQTGIILLILCLVKKKKFKNKKFTIQSLHLLGLVQSHALHGIWDFMPPKCYILSAPLFTLNHLQTVCALQKRGLKVDIRTQ